MAGKYVTLVTNESIRLFESSHNDSVAQTIAMLYLDSAPILLQVMTDAIDQGNLRRLSGAAQALASSSANLGAMRLANLCRRMAELPSKQALGNARDLLLEINHATDQVCAQLTEQIGSPMDLTELSA
jgi:two-component system, sensor histidine kinase and response regulator